MSLANETPDHTHIASHDEAARVAIVAEPILEALRTHSPGRAINVLIYLCAETMLSVNYEDGEKKLGPVEGWELVSNAINKSIAGTLALEAAAKEPK